MHHPFSAPEVKHHLQRENHVTPMVPAQIRSSYLLIFSACGELTKPAQLPDWACGQLCRINYGPLKPTSLSFMQPSPLHGS